MTGSAFEAMDVVVANKIVNSEEVWKREDKKSTQQELPRMTGSAFEAMDVVYRVPEATSERISRKRLFILL